MRNKTNVLGKIDPARIQSVKMLTDFLAKLGFKSQPVRFKNVNIVHKNKFAHEPIRWLVAQENHLESHAVVSIEGNCLCIYYYENNSVDLYRLWVKLEGELEGRRIFDEILAAMTMNTLIPHIEKERAEREKEMRFLIDSINIKFNR
jgi:hypothetical protein